MNELKYLVGGDRWDYCIHSEEYKKGFRDGYMKAREEIIKTKDKTVEEG